MSVVIDGISFIPEPEQPEEISLDMAEIALLKAIFDKEGLDYALHSYSSFSHGPNLVCCKRFHQLRKSYLSARKAMIDYTDSFGIET